MLSMWHVQGMQVHMEKKSNPSVEEHRQKKSLQDAAASMEILPDVSLVLQNSSRSFSEVGARVAAFQKQLIELQNQGAEEIANQKVEFEAKLKSQREEIIATEASNSRITAAIEDIRKKNAVLRKKASQLANASNIMRAEIEHVQDKMTLATEYMQETLKLSEKLLDSSEVQVLSELAEEEAMLERRWKHEKLVQSVSMLQVQSEPTLSTHDLMRDLRSSLADAAKETAASEAALKQEFEKKYQRGEEDLKAVRDLQEKLNTTFAGEKKLQQKLITALQHLEKVYSQLAQRRTSIRKFVENNVLNATVTH